MMMKKKFTLAGLALLGTTLVGSLFAQGLHPQPTNQEEAQKIADLRRGFFLVAEWNVYPFFWMAVPNTANNFPYDVETATRLAERITLTAELIPVLLALDTREFDIETHARDNLWNNLASVNRMATDLENNANQFVNAIANNPEPRANVLLPQPVLTAYQAMSSSACGDCHNSYRDTLPNPTNNAAAWVFTAGEPRPQPNNVLWAQRVADTQNGLALIFEWLQQPVDLMIAGELPFDAESAAQQADYIARYAPILPELMSQDPNFCGTCGEVTVTPVAAAWAEVENLDEVAAAIVAKAEELAELFADADGDEVPEDVAAAWEELSELLTPGA